MIYADASVIVKRYYEEPGTALVRRHPLRGFDAVHLAAALWLQRELGEPVEFWVADERLEAAARRERVVVVNPESRP